MSKDPDEGGHQDLGADGEDAVGGAEDPVPVLRADLTVRQLQPLKSERQSQYRLISSACKISIGLEV